MIWIFHFIAILVLFFLTKKNNNAFIYLSFIYTLFVFGQRWMTGVDFPYYLNYYLTGFVRSEVGYFAIQELFRMNDLYFGLLIFVMLFISLINNFRFILKFKGKALIILFVYLLSELYFGQMSQIRQYIAISFFINSYYYSYENKKYKSALNLLLAVSFHFSAIFMVVFLLFKPKMKRISMLIILIISLALPLINITSVFNLPIFNVYAHYLSSDFNTSLGGSHYIKYYVFNILFLVYILQIKPFKETFEDNLILNGMIFYIVLYGFSLNFAPLFRVSNYFKIFEIVYLVYYFDKISFFSEKLIKNILLTVFFLTYIGMAYTNSARITEYQFRRLRLTEDRSVQHLYKDINEFIYSGE